MAKKAHSLARKDYGYNSQVSHAKKSPISLRSAWKSLNKPREYRSKLPSSRKAQLGIIGLVLGLIIFMGAVSPNIPVVLGDYNSTFSHSRTAIYQENSGNWDSSRWSFNSTCVSFVGQLMEFAYKTGASGSGGNNCASADQAITNAPVSLSTVSAKQLEMDFLWFANTHGGGCALCYTKAEIMLRTNGTLPSFTENYSPVNDVQNRFVFDACPINFGTCGASGAAGYFIQHDSSKSISSEGGANDAGPTITLPGSGEGTVMNIQAVINYTGSTHFMAYKESLGGNTASNPTGSFATYLLPSLDYYIMVKGLFDTTKTPTANIEWDFDMGTHNIVSAPDAFGIWTVPAACEDRLNVANASCNQAAPAGYSLPSTGNLSLFNPVSWIVYLGKVFIWAIQQALGAIILAAVYFSNLVTPFLNTLATLLFGVMKAVLNAVGSAIGIANLGDNVFTLLADLATWFTTNFGNIVLTIVNIITGTANMLSAIGTILTNYWLGFTGFLSALGNFFSNFWTIAGLVIGIPFSLLFSGWILYGTVRFAHDFQDGMEWYRTTGEFVMIGVGLTWYFIILLLDHVIDPISQAIQAMAQTAEAIKPPAVAG